MSKGAAQPQKHVCGLCEWRGLNCHTITTISDIFQGRDKAFKQLQICSRDQLLRETAVIDHFLYISKVARHPRSHVHRFLLWTGTSY